MTEKVRYQVRARSLIDMVNALKSESLILSPFFQRKLVWREIHKIDFIKTILLGYPFPEIFIARGGIDVENMTSISCVVDGQQRMNAILEFVSDKFKVDGKKYSDFKSSEKEQILKYEIAVIELDLDQDAPEVIQIFKRLNRTFYSLSQIEKLSTEYASSNFMLLAKLLCGELVTFDEENEAIEQDYNVNPELPNSDPNITMDFVRWANAQDISSIVSFLLFNEIFSGYEISRQVHLMYILNVQATYLHGLYARNERVIEALEHYTEKFDEREDLVKRIDSSAKLILSLPELHSYWFSKSNSFSLLVALDERRSKWSLLDRKKLAKKLNDFAENPDSEYSLAAKEAVNNKKERLIRNKALLKMIDSCYKSATKKSS